MVHRATGLILTGALSTAPAPAGAQETEAGVVVTIPDGAVREGDLYAWGEAIRVHGQLAGDLVAVGQRVLVDGQVDGDVFAAARTVDLRGPIGDSTRIVGDQVTVNASIDGDLIAGANRLQLLEGTVIRGGLVATASSIEVDGTVEDDLRAAAGEIMLRGAVLGNANVIADRLDLAPEARIEGDLDYRTRIPLSPEAAARVAGAVRYEEPSDEDDDSGSLLWWMWRAGAALLAGLLAVALFPRLVRQLTSAIEGETTLGALLGFGALLIVPIAAAMVMATVVGLPIGIIAMLLYGVALYVAKLPIAVWAGGLMLVRAGRPEASPYAAMAVGIPVLYVLFEIPWLGGLLQLATICLGLGAMVLSGRRHLSANASQGPARAGSSGGG